MNKFLVEKIRRTYTKRLLEALKEVDVVDNDGNVLISKDLKVFHKDSGYEYTVNDVVSTPDGIKIVLRNPEEPRFLPADATEILDEMAEELQDYLGDMNIDDDLDTGDLFVVDEESFEKEYEVK